MDATHAAGLVGQGENMGLISRLPWWAKLGGKLVLSRLHIPYKWWRAVGLFRHGDMSDPARSIATFRRYYEQALQFGPLPAGFHSLELGPGDSVLSGIAARAFGAQRAWLVDAGRYADTGWQACQRAIELLAAEGRTLPPVGHAQTVDELLAALDIAYLTGGIDSLCSIPDASVDFIWSQVVLEHVPRSQFMQLLTELRRVASPAAIGIHSIDFRDHLAGSLNNLRFTEHVWESQAFRNGGFYTNRLRPREMIGMFQAAGFEPKILAEARWPAPPIPRSKLAPTFARLHDEDFMVAELDLLTRAI